MRFGVLGIGMVSAALTALQPAASPVATVSAAPIEGSSSGASATGTLAPAQTTATTAIDDVADYTLTATLDVTKHTIHGEGTISWRNASALPVRELWVHLYLNAFKNERSVFLREPDGNRGNGGVTTWGSIDVHKLVLHDASGSEDSDLWPAAELHRPGDEDETDARVPLPRDVAPGEEITLDVVWDDQLPSVVERTGFDGSLHFAGQWFPKIARLEPSGKWAHFPFHHLAEFYADFGTYDVTINVPASFVIGATGPVVDSKIAAGRRIERHVQPGIHDYAWTAWDKWRSLKESIEGVAVTVLFPSGCEGDARRELASIRFALPHFRDRYGNYPYPVLTLVHPPDSAGEVGGMEYPTLITTGSPWYYPPGIFVPELYTIHEFGHQYFYGLIATDEVSWPFLDEGLNSYAEEETLAAWKGPGSLATVLGFTLSDAAVQGIWGNARAHDQAVALPAYAFTTGTSYADLVYERTGALVETLRRVYGDETVTRALGLYARQGRFHHPVPEDLLQAFNQVAGGQVAQTLRTALFEKGWVDYTVTAIFSRKAASPAGLFDRNGKRETAAAAAGGGFEGWVLVTRRGTLSFPVEVELTREDGSTERVRWDGGAESQRFAYTGKVGLRSAVVDPDHAVLLDENLTNNFASVPATRVAGAPRTLERITYWAELALQALLP
jgi:hypothetical protein